MGSELLESYYNDLKEYYKLKTKYEDLKQKKVTELIGNKIIDYNEKKTNII